MRRVYGIGEALLDIIFKNDQPVEAVAGGSTLNSIVSLGRMNHQTFLVSETGNDRIGEFIARFLYKNGVSDQFLSRGNNSRSPVALAFLDEKNDAEYEIFKDYSSQSLEGTIPMFKANDIVLFGSFFALNPTVRPRLVNYLETARDSGAIIIYDPNYRNHHSHDIKGLINIIEENFMLSNIVRGSNEDFKNIYGIADETAMAEKVSDYCPNVIVTASSRGVYLHADNCKEWFPTPELNPVSTIGAGDSFNAGLVHGIIEAGILGADINGMSQPSWKAIIAHAIAFASNVCCSLENYVSTSYHARADEESRMIARLFNAR